MRRTIEGLGVALLVSSLLVMSSCGSSADVPARAGEQATSAVDSAPDSGDVVEQGTGLWISDASLRASLEGDNAALIGTVVSVRGQELQVVTDEVLSAGLGARHSPQFCSELEVGYKFDVTNTTEKFQNDLREGDRALFSGQLCDEGPPDNRMELVASAPNGRRMNADGTIDLGGGDKITVEEARKIAGRSFAPVPVAADQLDVDAFLEGASLRVMASGSSTARIGVTLCDPGIVELASPPQDYFGRCLLQTFDPGIPYRVVDGKLDVTLKLGAGRSRPFDVVVFGENDAGLFQVRGIASVG